MGTHVRPDGADRSSVSPDALPPRLPSPVAVELRRRRELLGISQVEVARRTGVSRTAVNQIESGQRVPSLRTYQRLRAGLGLLAPPAAALLAPPPARGDVLEDRLTALAAALLASRGTTLAALADAVDVTVPAVREELPAIAARLAAVGMTTVDDGIEVRLVPLPVAAAAVAAVTALDGVDEVSAEQVAVLCIVAYRGIATRRQIEKVRGEDSESLLLRLVRRGLLHCVPDRAARGGPNVYRVTAKALGLVGHPTLESLQSFLARTADPRKLAALNALDDEPAAAVFGAAATTVHANDEPAVPARAAAVARWPGEWESGGGPPTGLAR